MKSNYFWSGKKRVYIVVDDGFQFMIDHKTQEISITLNINKDISKNFLSHYYSVKGTNDEKNS